MGTDLKRMVGIAYLLSGMAIFGSATPITKIVGEGIPIFTASCLRVLLGALVLLPFVAKGLRREVGKIGRGDWIHVALIALFGMVGFTLLLILGMRIVSGVAGSLIMSFTPALTALAAVLFMGSTLDWRKAVAIALGVAGVVLVNVYKRTFEGGESSEFYLGAALVLLAICCEAAYSLLGKKTTESLSPLLTSFLACILSLPLFAVLAAFDVRSVAFGAASLDAWLALLWWGMGTLGAGSALWYSGLSRADGATAAGFMAVMPISALILSYFLLGEAFHPVHLIGVGLVMGSVGLMSWTHMTEGSR